MLHIRIAEGYLLDTPGTVWEMQGSANQGRIINREGAYDFEFSYRDSDYDVTTLWSLRAFPVADGYTLAVQGTGCVEQEKSPIRIDYAIDRPLTDKPNGRVIDGVVLLDAHPRSAAKQCTRTSFSMHPAVYGKVRGEYGPEKWVTLEIEGETYVSKLYTILD